MVFLGAPLKSAMGHKAAILIELGSECLAVYLNEKTDSNVLGFARYRNGLGLAPSDLLIELVRG